MGTQTGQTSAHDLSQPWAHLASAPWKTAFLLWVHVQDEPQSPSQYFTPQLFSEKHPSPKAQFQAPGRDHMNSSAGVRCLLTPPRHCQTLRSHCRLSYRQSSPCTQVGWGWCRPPEDTCLEEGGGHFSLLPRVLWFQAPETKWPI